MRKLKKRDRSSLRTVLLFVATMNRMNDEINEHEGADLVQKKEKNAETSVRIKTTTTLLPKMSAITTATFQPISQKMRLGSARRSSSVSSSFQRGHAAKIAAAPMMKKVGVKLYRDLSHLFLNLKERRYFYLVS